MFRPHVRWSPLLLRFALAAAPIALVMLLSASSAPAAERPAAPRLLPKSTLAYARIEDVNEMREALKASGIGRMMRDEQLKPLVGDLYLSAAELFAEISDHVGVSLDELISIPQGEFAVAVVPLSFEEPEAEEGPKDESEEAIRQRIEQRRNQSPLGVVGLIDTGENAHLMRRIIEEREEDARNSGFERTVREVAGTEVIVYSTTGTDITFSFAERDGTFIFGIGARLVDEVLERWENGGSEGTLAQSTDFGSVMSHCVGAEETRPQLTFYADPYHLVELLVKQAGGPAAFVWPILEQLEFEKIRGIGGSSFSGGDEDFESILHVHILLGSPRDGILSVVRPIEGPIEPESWVPADVISYTTLHWDLLRTYEGVDRIITRFQDGKALERMVDEPLKERTGIDLRVDVLGQLTGRVGIVRWNEPPMRLNSSTQCWAIETKDIAKAEETLRKFLDSFGDGWEKDVLGGRTIFVMRSGDQGNFPDTLRRPEPTVAIIGNYIIGSDSRKAIEHLIQTEAGNSPRLSESADYALIAAETTGKLDADKPFLFSYLRSEEIFRQIYEMAKDPNNRQFLRQAAEDNRVAKMLYDALEKNQLPAFSAFSKYFAPSGAFAYDAPTGLHYTTFTLKPVE